MGETEMGASCFNEQRYKIFESNSQHKQLYTLLSHRCFNEQRYKIFESNSQLLVRLSSVLNVVSMSKDTRFLKAIHNGHCLVPESCYVVSMSKDTRFLKAIHNKQMKEQTNQSVVSMSKDTRFLKAIHNLCCRISSITMLFQ